MVAETKVDYMTDQRVKVYLVTLCKESAFVLAKKGSTHPVTNRKFQSPT
jgi:hypothetical protein